MAGCLRAMILFLYFASVLFIVESMNLTQSLRSRLNHFTETRNVAVNPAAKQKARDYIVKTFKDHGLYTWTEEFPSNNAQYPGINIIGQLPGRYTGSRDDNILLIGSHYDSVKTTPGVDDNGSGMTALLQALQLYTNPDKINCKRDYTLLFVAFDLEEWQPSCPTLGNCSCVAGLCGSFYFVQNFSHYLNSTGANFQGAVILETILNYNTTPNSQALPASASLYFKLVYEEISKNSFRGDFLAVIGRLLNDNKLVEHVTEAFNSDATFKSLAVTLASPLGGRPVKWPLLFRTAMSDFFRSDHYVFWNAEPSLPAVFITDTADFRGYMRQCYHQSCDDISQVTPDMITFLARTTKSIAKVASNMTNQKCEMKQADCVQEIVSDKGEITSPYFGSQYPNNLDCAWTIKLKTVGVDMNFTFVAFDLEESTNCSADYVEIRDKDKTGAFIGRYCGKTIPPIKKHWSSFLHVAFHSDELGAFKGFKAEFISEAKVIPATSSSAGRPFSVLLKFKCYRQGLSQLIGILVMTLLFLGLQGGQI